MKTYFRESVDLKDSFAPIVLIKLMGLENDSRDFEKTTACNDRSIENFRNHILPKETQSLSVNVEKRVYTPFFKEYNANANYNH